MIRVVSFVTLTEDGLRKIGTLADIVSNVRDIVTSNGGALEQVWQTAGIYDFVAVLSFPDLKSEFRSRNEVYKMGVLRADHVPAVPMSDALELVGG
jgi:uncharacterized protein with GYD domain